MPLAALCALVQFALGLRHELRAYRRLHALYREPLVGAPGFLPRDGGLIQPLDAHVNKLALPRGIWTAGDLPVALLVGEPVTDLKLHWQDRERLTGHPRWS